MQDRLVKELRLAGIGTIEAANRFVEAWLPSYNRRFAVQPAQAADLHRPPPAGGDLNRILCLKTSRCLRRDWTCLLYTSDAADERSSVDLGGRRIIKKKNTT